MGSTSELKELGTPVIQSFEATPAVINAGDVTSLRWNTINSQSVSIDNGIGDVAISGTLPISPTTTTFYTLTAKNSLGTATARTQIIVQTPSVPTTSTTPRILLFISDRTTIMQGEHVTLKWNVTESSIVRITPIDSVNASGELRVYPTETTTFTLTASNSAGESTVSQKITVINPAAQEQGREYQFSPECCTG
ncbi:MAG TPA: hypothetical protein DCX22_00505 [Dehalococcoidia bacterium]|nr:hypothetical protein [Dehalococcoidia bacterium]